MRLSFQMPARLEAIDALVLDLRHAVEPLVSAEALFGFEVAASEALTNVVRHSIDPLMSSSEAKVQVTLDLDETTVSLELLDQGKPGPADMFATVPNLDDIDPLAEHGRGLALIQHYTKSADYSTGPNGNRLRLVFNISSDTQPKDD